MICTRIYFIFLVYFLSIFDGNFLMDTFNNIWQSIKRNGCDNGLTKHETKTIIYTNTLLFISVVAYLVFIISIYTLKVFTKEIFALSSAVMLTNKKTILFIWQNLIVI
jgi:hypothetical protein